MLQLMCTLRVAGLRVASSLNRRRSDERGQTAAEYLGIIVIVAIIIAAIATSSLKTDLAGDITKKIQEIFNNK
jgi:Flp pilus assembly pilin Flp